MNINRKKLWRSVAVASIVVAASFLLSGNWQQARRPPSAVPPGQRASLASIVLSQLAIQPAAPKAGYSRKQFSDGWAKTGTCTIRDKILARDMTHVQFRAPGNCTVISGTLDDPYTGKIINFIRGPSTSATVQIDHVVAVSDAWQTGAQQLTKPQREQLYNDPLELIAADGPANEQKGDGDASEWLPPNSKYDCPYVARQIAVKKKYHLWVTSPELTAMRKILASCPAQMVPSVSN